MCKISVIIPVYNAEDTIEKCINSIINQTYTDYEIIAINDGSKDNSFNILKNYEKILKDKIKIINQKNQGVSKTRNNAIKLANGDFITFIDNDDFIDKDYLKTYISEIDNSDFDVVIGGYRRVDENNKILYQKKLHDTQWSKYLIVSPWSKIFRRNFLIENKIEFLEYKIGEDVYFNLSILAHNPRVKILKYIGYNWYFNSKSVSNTSQKGLSKDIDITYLLEKIDAQYIKRDELLNYYYIRYYIWYLLFSGRNSNSSRFMDEYKRIKDWYIKKNIQLNISPFSSKIKGESLKDRLIVFMFITFEKLHLIKLFSKIYCRGEV